MLATAAGGTSGTQLEALRYAMSKRAVVVSATRTGAGRVVAPGEPGRVLAVPGTLGAEDLTPIKARILLMLALDAQHRSARHPADAPRVLTLLL